MEHGSSNRVTLAGEIYGELEYSHILFGEAFYSCKIAVQRLSGALDILPVTVSERLLDLCNLHEGKSVTITGQLRSYNKFVENTNRLILTIFAQEIVEEKSTPKNEIYICGYVCKQPIYRTTPFHREIADILLAVNRAYNKSDYIPCITWGRNARYAQNMPIGCKVEAYGRIQSREYQKASESGEVNTRTAYEVSVSTMEIVEE